MDYYLIDTENVSGAWVGLLPGLEAGDEMLLLYTANSPRLSYRDLGAVLSSDKGAMVHAVPAAPGEPGRNALDFQLISLLGWLIAKHEGQGAEFLVISDDRGYDPAVKFWQGRGSAVSRLGRKEVAARAAKAERREAEAAAAADERAEKKRKFWDMVGGREYDSGPAPWWDAPIPDLGDEPEDEYGEDYEDEDELWAAEDDGEEAEAEEACGGTPWTAGAASWKAPRRGAAGAAKPRPKAKEGGPAAQADGTRESCRRLLGRARLGDSLEGVLDILEEMGGYDRALYKRALTSKYGDKRGGTLYRASFPELERAIEADEREKNRKILERTGSVHKDIEPILDVLGKKPKSKAELQKELEKRFGKHKGACYTGILKPWMNELISS